MKVGKNGTIVLPEAIQRQLGIAEGSELDIDVNGQSIVLQPVRSRKRSLLEKIDHVAGGADAGLTTDEILGMTREK
ncbi:MAG: AbrB/MazE/SpoVT family DNA-binding domain-containing protein [Opitutales bacterium]